jgi:hypothetical protein
MSEDDFTTELRAGDEVPVRRLGERYILGYDYFMPEEFIHFVDLLLKDEGETESGYSTDDVKWAAILDIEFDEPPRIVFGDIYDDEAIPVTVLECW